MAAEGVDTAGQQQTLEEIREGLGLTYRQIAEAIDVPESQLRAWRTGTLSPSPIFAARIERLQNLLVEMNRTFVRPADGRKWLKRRLPVLEQRSPLELVREGKSEEVTSLLFDLNAGIPN